MAPANLPNFYSCTCPDGITGVNCESLKNPCVNTNPCVNNSTCIDVSTFTNPSSYVCYCEPGYTGPNCEVRLSVCDLKPVKCLNGGICQETSAISFTCLCLSNYTGASCNIKIDACFNNNCYNGATCIPQDNNYIW